MESGSIYVNRRGWWFSVRPGLSLNHYRVFRKKSIHSSWEPVATTSWCSTAAEAEEELKVFAEKFHLELQQKKTKRMIPWHERYISRVKPELLRKKKGELIEWIRASLAEQKDAAVASALRGAVWAGMLCYGRDLKRMKKREMLSIVADMLDVMGKENLA